MKLIDLLVRELPKRGGWPAGADCCCISGVDPDGVTIQFRFIPRNNKFLFCPDYDHLDIPYQGDATEFITCEVITKEQYESALAESQKPAWNGEGLPPVWCECEYQYKVHGSEWCKFECVAVDGKAVFGWSNNTPVALQSNTNNFSPLRTEAERKRDEAISEIGKASQLISNNKEQIKHIAKHIYDAIAAGKIPGVKLDD